MQFVPIESAVMAHKQYIADKAEMAALMNVRGILENEAISAKNKSGKSIIKAAKITFSKLSALYNDGLLYDTDLTNAVARSIITESEKAAIIEMKSTEPKTFILEIVPSGHKWGAWEVVEDYGDGTHLEKRTCKICGYSETGIVEEMD